MVSSAERQGITDGLFDVVVSQGAPQVWFQVSPASHAASNHGNIHLIIAIIFLLIILNFKLFKI